MGERRWGSVTSIKSVNRIDRDAVRCSRDIFSFPANPAKHRFAHTSGIILITVFEITSGTVKSEITRYGMVP